MSKWRVTCEILSSGQPRPYADSRTVGRLTIKWQGMAGFKDKKAPFILNEGLLKGAGVATVKKFVRAFISDFREEDDKSKSWADATLEYLKEVSPGVYEAAVVRPFTD